jgi:hypothetical protein
MVNASSWSRGGGTGLPETCGDGIKESSRLATIDRWQGRVGAFGVTLGLQAALI